MRTGLRAGYRVIEWESDWDPSLEDILQRFPNIVIERHVAIASCDSGPYRPTDFEVASGWYSLGDLAVSPRIETISQLPTPGFDEWYVYDNRRNFGPHRSFVNHFGFSPLKDGDALTEEFWAQIAALRPIHVLGAGTPILFLVTCDESLYREVAGAGEPLM